MNGEKVRLGIFSHNLADIGGTPKCAHNQIRPLAKDYDLYYFAYQDGFRRQLLEQDGIKVFVGKDNRAIKKLVKEHRIDILHLHRSGSHDETTDLIKKCRRHVGKIVETNVFGEFDPKGNRYIDYHIFISDFGYQRVKAKDPSIEGSYIKLNFDVEDYFLREKDYTRRIIGRHSRPSPAKWHSVCADAPILLKKRGVNFEYLVLGMIPEVEEKLRSAEVNLRVEQNTEGNAIVKEVLSQITVFVHGSVIGEIQPGSILEAFSAKTPVVTFDSGHRDVGHVEFVKQSGAGFVAKSVEEYADYVERLLSNPEECRELGERGHRWVKEHFATDVVLKDYRKVLEHLMR